MSTKYIGRMKMKRVINPLVIAVFSSAVMFMLTGSPPFASAEDASHPAVGIVQHLGKKIDMNLSFIDSNGKRMTLADLSDGKPLIIDMAYYTCPGICDAVFGGVQDVLEKISDAPGKDYRVATISFDTTDTPARARQKKGSFVGMMNRPFPSDAWRFLTGDSANIYKLTNELGFYFIRNKDGKTFTHPTALIFVSKEGKITRYIYGTTFNAIDVEMAILNAKQNKFAPIIGTVLKMCFSYDPSEKGYGLDTLEVVGWGTTIFLLGVGVFLWRTKKLKHARGGN